ncbi:MAG: ATP-dependent helicase, partial [Acidimicrobiales bacterium]
MAVPLGRGVVVAAGADAPAAWPGAPRVRVDDDTLAAPAAAVEDLHRHWSNREPVVIELAVDADELRRPPTEDRAPYLLDAGFDLGHERLHFLVWANNYDARRGEPVWWHGVRATRLGAAPGGPADVLLEDGTPAWCDGGPRQPLDVPEAVVHRDSIDAGALRVARARASAADLADDQRAAVEHPGGPARIIAPAGSGKTRVLTERLRHLIADRGHEPHLVTAVAYNVKAADELRDRTEGLAPNIRTLNSLGLRICELAGPVRVIDEIETRRIVESLVHVNRRINTDPVAPYLDALSAIRLGLVDPEDAEGRFPDATGVAAAFPAYRAALADRGAVDFDEQIYRAIELCLSEPEIRTRARATTKTLLVDEFQDLTPAHVLLIRLLAGPAASVFGVGDDDQVIYGYAGADPGFLIDFARFFPGAASYDLTVNYRCPTRVVKAAETLLTHNRRRLPKTIAASPGRDEAPTDLVVDAVEDDDLAPAVVRRAQEWMDAGLRGPNAVAGVDATDIAVLARVNSVLLPVQIALVDAGVPCTRAVGPDLLSRTGMTAALAYLRMGLDPQSISRADVLATIRRPSRRIARNVVDMIVKRPNTSV